MKEEVGAFLRLFHQKLKIFRIKRRRIMKSPFTGGKVTLQQEKSELIFRKEKFQYVSLYYQCEDTKERFTTTEIDEINLGQVYNQYRAKYGIPIISDGV